MVVLEVAAEEKIGQAIVVDIPHTYPATIVEITVGVHIEFGCISDIVAKGHTRAVRRHEGEERRFRIYLFTAEQHKQDHTYTHAVSPPLAQCPKLRMLLEKREFPCFDRLMHL